MKYALALIAVLFSCVARAEMDELVRVEATMAECDKGTVCACPDSPALELSTVKTCGEYIPNDKAYAQCHDRVVIDGLAGLIAQFKPDRPSCFLLPDGCSIRCVAAGSDILDCSD
jgi:hypothetical protein